MRSALAEPQDRELPLSSCEIPPRVLQKKPKSAAAASYLVAIRTCEADVKGSGDGSRQRSGSRGARTSSGPRLGRRCRAGSEAQESENRNYRSRRRRDCTRDARTEMIEGNRHAFGDTFFQISVTVGFYSVRNPRHTECQHTWRVPQGQKADLICASAMDRGGSLFHLSWNPPSIVKETRLSRRCRTGSEARAKREQVIRSTYDYDGRRNCSRKLVCPRSAMDKGEDETRLQDLLTACGIKVIVLCRDSH